MTCPVSQSELIDLNVRYFRTAAWGATHWEGVPCQKSPNDLLAYQELVFELQPQAVVELGTYLGGTTLFLARLLDILGSGRIVSVDVEDKQRPEHQRVTYVVGDSVSEPVVSFIRDWAGPRSPVLVIADSDHSKSHVRRELELYWPIVTPGSYMIVEDTNHRWLNPDSRSTPWDAVDEFVRERIDVEVDGRFQRSHVLTFCPGGYLRKLGAKR